MKRKFTDIHCESDSDPCTTFQSRKRRRRIVEQSSQSQSDDDTTMDEFENENDDAQPNTKRLSLLHLSSHISLTISDQNASDDSQTNSHAKIKTKTHKKLMQTRLKLRDNSWNCEACTFKNETQSTKCEICDTKRTPTTHQLSHDNDTVTTDSGGEIDVIAMENNDFKKVAKLPTKTSRKKDVKLTKNISIVDLTTNDIKPKKKTIKKKGKKKKDAPQMSSIGGNRSRSKYYSNLLDKKQKKKKKKTALSKTESIESVKQNEFIKTSNVMERISDDNDCVITKDKRSTQQKLQSEQWIDKYAPQHMNDLYVHKRKLQDVDEWFGNAFGALDDTQLRRLQHVKSILFLVGQSGIGKTSMIQCLCDKYNAKLLCYPSMDANIKTYNATIWDNDKTHFTSFSSMNRSRHTHIDIRDESQMNKLDAFLNRSKRFGSLRLIGNPKQDNGVCIHKRQVIWIRELPYVGQDQYLYRFRAIVEKMCNTTRNIVIFEITTEFEGTRDDLQVFGNEIRLHPRVTTIRMNPVNNTLMKRCLKQIMTAENMNKHIADTTGLITHIMDNVKGDLRNAIQTLQMRLVELSYGNAPQIISNKQKKKKKKKKKKKIKSSLQSAHVGGREETLSLFHCLGKILYAKKEMSPEEAIEKSNLDCIKFNDLLYENFGDFFVYNEHFIMKQNDAAVIDEEEVDEFGFAMDDMFESEAANMNGFEEYCETLNYFADADLCCESYASLRYSDTSTDLRSSVNHIQFGSQLYPAIYAASVAARGYLISHDKQPKLKLKGKKRGLNAIRGSRCKVSKQLRDELSSGFGDVIRPPQAALTFAGGKNEHYVSENELAFLRAFMCQPTSLYVDVLPSIANMKDNNAMERVCGVRNRQLCVSLIRASNWYSHKYECKTLVASRFDHLHNNATNNTRNERYEEDVDEGDKDLINQIEEYNNTNTF
eukprot:152888_1